LALHWSWGATENRLHSVYGNSPTHHSLNHQFTNSLILWLMS